MCFSARTLVASYIPKDRLCFAEFNVGDTDTMSDIAFEVLEGAIKEMERAHLGIDAIVHALVAEALHFAYCHVGENTAKEMIRDAVEEAISGIEELDCRPH
jgi:hypothetical protein